MCQSELYKYAALITFLRDQSKKKTDNRDEIFAKNMRHMIKVCS